MTSPISGPSFAIDERRFNYLIHISERFNLIYVEIPKAGCTTIKRILQLAELEGERTMLPSDVHNRETSPLKRPRETDGRFVDIWNSEATHRFVFARNPFTRALSCYLDKIVESQWERDRRMPILDLDPEVDVDFATFLERVSWQPAHRYDIHWAPQTLLTGIPMNRYDGVYYFEEFAKESLRLLRNTGLEAYKSEIDILPSHATGAAEQLESFIGQREADLVRNIYADDFLHFGYSPRVEDALEPPDTTPMRGRDRSIRWTL
ncbi:MAG: sulfotransferase family 2 domain-containing protein [Acidobacteria bacterium]|nr:sulfotransferase family 2 domain-containing protein [Acidobacteriota bacterium]